MKKIFLAIMVLFISSGAVFSAVTPEEVRSAKVLKEKGYSSTMINAIQKEANEYNPKPTNFFQRFCFKLWNYVDPNSPEPRDAQPHDIKMHSSFSDL